jgi:hypothetical protein
MAKELLMERRRGRRLEPIDQQILSAPNIIVALRRRIDGLVP